ncbi:MAG: DNA repair protein RadC [Acidobacteria bacterium]|nr:DNA repair protein RadC [Acidobacteriota bacterium]MCB9398507.1 DNA repair protein RadC [Acidobacteriota bacterium]
MGHRERLWQKLERARFGDAFVHPYEKLEFLLTWVLPRVDTKPIAKMLLQQFGSLSALFFAPKQKLMAVPGIGPRTARFLHVLGEIYLDMEEEKLKKGPLLADPRAVRNFLTAEIAWQEAEFFLVLFLDAKNHLIAQERLFRGTIDRSAVFPREVVKEALLRNARCVIVAHNHPSGDPTPSQEDLNLTRRLAQTLTLMDITFHDHVIVGREGMTNLRETHPELWLG